MLNFSIFVCHYIKIDNDQLLLQKRFAEAPNFFSMGGSKDNPLIQMERSYYSIRPAPRKIFSRASDTIILPCKYASFPGADHSITPPKNAFSGGG